MSKGGKRDNAGRKPVGRDKKEVLSVRLSPYLINLLKSKGNPGEVLEKILSEYFNGRPSAKPKKLKSEWTDVVYRAIKACPGSFNQQLISVWELRASLPGVEKKNFDSSIWTLVKREKLFLHRHIHPIRLNEEQRARCVEDEKGNFYIGIVLREKAR